jgi:putative ABC transport system substrate-binding protein
LRQPPRRNAVGSAPEICSVVEFAVAGGLIGYGPSIPRRGLSLVSTPVEFLKGEDPANLPVLQVARVELVINLRAAKMPGTTFPLTLLGRSDEVIE